MSDPDPTTEPTTEPSPPMPEGGGAEHLSRHERFDIIEQAAIEAELETGRREETIAGAKRSILVRIVTGTLGGFLILAGLVMLLVPGPGLLAIALGLGLIAPDVPFAARLLDRVKERLPQDEDGKLPPTVIAGMVVTFVAATGVSIWWAFFR